MKVSTSCPEPQGNKTVKQMTFYHFTLQQKTYYYGYIKTRHVMTFENVFSILN